MMSRCCCMLIVCLGFLAATQLNAQPQPQPQPQPQFGDADRTEIPAVIHRYFAAFTAKDYASFGDYFQAPFLGYGRDPGIVPTFEEVLKRYQSIRDPLDQADYSSSKAVEIRLTPMTPFLALANVHWQRYRKDGTLLNEGSEFMVMNKSTGAWKIAGVLPQQFLLFGK